ncbi:NERD domain-containing protein [Paenibacillus melissococcoides]|uniref:NERD domain-containing protein n=1 Tax=Paenibacillus melissococcoides TaxID=2912268 RepID=A0ABN8UFS3_9BACL|nr:MULTISPECIES: nuclease-related domain-containing protein [Paenibacillus]MEB9897604.1 nuclease-related domain-containing protein [Bacillus cereus]GIO82303.1 hypothetical protein J6TS7_59130 [Paenibacillus dendritiformis]CAH8249564.1 NERD domain-containing protein [Paenibacillus melissococcoides]CAH8721067.1 NERD domain-containing protein [Paenibacillus melissococcoides]
MNLSILLIAFVCSIFGFLLLLLFKKSRTRQLHSGRYRGERLSKTHLIKADDEKIYENICVSHEELTVKIERIIVRTNGIFLIIRKNRSGCIAGTEQDDFWIQTKTNPTTGEVTQKYLRNPLIQTKLHIFVLSQKLSELDCNTWIQGIVVFTNPRVLLETNTEEIPVLYPEQLDSFIQTYRPSREISNNMITKINAFLGAIEPNAEKCLQ